MSDLFDSKMELIRENGLIPFFSMVDTGRKGSFNPREFVKMYDIIFSIIDKNRGDVSRLVENFTSNLEYYICKYLIPKMNVENGMFLECWTTNWNNSKLVFKGLCKIYMFVEQFLKTNEKLHILCIKIYRDLAFSSYSDRVLEILFQDITKNREKAYVDTQLITNGIKVLLDFGDECDKKNPLVFYESLFLPKFLEQTMCFYTRHSQFLLEKKSMSEYIEEVNSILIFETNCVYTFLHPTTKNPLLEVCYNTLLQTPKKRIFDEMIPLFQRNATDVLTKLYNVYNGHPEDLATMAEEMGKYISTLGIEYVGLKTNYELVNSLIDLYNRFTDFTKNCFDRNPVFIVAIRNAFIKFIDQNDKFTKLLATFSNDILVKNSKILNKNISIESVIDSIVHLYGFITDKDVFEHTYQNLLANRLLLNLSESEDNEKMAIAKFKIQCGYQWTSRLEMMFKDTQANKEMQMDFRKLCTSKDIELRVNVCTTGHWPHSKTIQGKIPEMLIPICKKYADFYHSTHSGHKIQWRWDHGQAEIQAQFNKDVRRTLMVTTYQMLILLVFNTTTQPISFQQIVNVTGIPAEELRMHLLSLAHPQVKVLLKKPNVKVLELTDLFIVNAQFTNTLLRVTIPLLTETKLEAQIEEDESINSQRQWIIDATIVRIMKTRKQIQHALLVSEVITQLIVRFQPNPALIKRCIESLIEREFICRDNGDRGLYNYLA